MIRIPDGLSLLPGYFDRTAQKALVSDIRAVTEAAPFFQPRMPRSGKPFSVEMTNCGPLGWVSDRDGGYRYQANHPATGAPWPPMPAALLALWHDVGAYPAPPEACLINHYRPGTRMGLHVDADEADFAAPVVSVSLGDDCRFRIGGTARRDPTGSIRLRSGDVVVLGGGARKIFHGVDRIYAATSPLLADWFPEGGRINLTLRRVTLPR